MFLLIQNMYNRAVLSGDMRLARDIEIRWQCLLNQQILRDGRRSTPITEEGVAEAA